MARYFDDDAVEDHFSDIEIEEYIDSGGFKDVFKAHWSGEEIVVKLIPIERTHLRRRARRETEAMIRIESDIFVDLIDFFEVEDIGGVPAFVITEEYLPGRTLEQVIDDGDHSLDLGIDVLRALLDISSEFEELGMIHRDLKPSNIIISPDGEPRVLDAGIVRIEERESLTPDHASRGPATPQYAAPEQLTNDKENQGPWTDLFSSAVVMFETITGKHPYRHDEKSESQAIIEGDKHDLSGFIDGDLGEGLQWLFDTMTQTDPPKRFPNASMAKEALEDVLSGD